MIKIIANKKQKSPKPYYKLIFHYMIGDGDGNTSKKVKISVNNPFIERFCKLLNNLKPPKGRWGVIIDEEHLDAFLEEKQITEDDYNFLNNALFDEYYDEDEDDLKKVEPYFKTEEENNFVYEFNGGAINEIGNKFTVFENVELKYIDELGREFSTKFVD